MCLTRQQDLIPNWLHNHPSYHWIDPISSQSAAVAIGLCSNVFIFRLVQTLLGLLRLPPQGDQVPWLRFPHHGGQTVFRREEMRKWVRTDRERP